MCVKVESADFQKRASRHLPFSFSEDAMPSHLLPSQAEASAAAAAMGQGVRKLQHACLVKRAQSSMLDAYILITPRLMRLLTGSAVSV